MSVLSELQTKVRSLLKAVAEDKTPDKGRRPAVPADPGDPDELQPDYRVGDASPTKADAEKAKDEAKPEVDGEANPGEDPAGEDGTVDPPKTTEEEEAGESEKPNPGEEGTEGEDPERPSDKDKNRPVAKGFDEFGNRDLDPGEVRSLLKALEYGVTPPMAQDKLLHEGEDLKTVLDDILKFLTHAAQKMESHDVIMSDLFAELDRLRKGADVHDREIAKALNMLGNPTTAPAEAPRALAKSFTPPTAVPAAQALPGADVANEIYSAMRAGKMTNAEAMQKCRETRAAASLQV
jgi:hypothetical protein